jgi:hypothetical protein
LGRNIGDIYEIDGQKYKVTNIKTTTYDDGSTVTTETAEPVEEGQE